MTKYYFFWVYLGQSPNVSSVGTPVSSNTCSTPVSKSMITNASFRTKKLPGNRIQLTKNITIILFLNNNLFDYYFR